ncbi:MAG: GNAT family N-acetyltransferase [Alteraurantiacibacter sp.]
MLDRQPVLEGGKVRLRPLREDDWDALYAVAAQQEIWAMHPMHDRWQEPVFREFFSDALEHGGALAVLDMASGAMLGSSRFQALSLAGEGAVEIGWTFLDPAVWGQGHNRELKRLMVGHALATLGRVDFRVGEANWRSRKALEKIGARLDESRFEEAEVPGIGPVRHVYYVIDRANFADGPLAA